MAPEDLAAALAELAAWIAEQRRPGGELYEPGHDPTL